MPDIDGEPKETKLIIRLTPDGKIEVTGPVENLIMCYGLLGMAKDAIQQAATERDKKRIQTGLSDDDIKRILP